MCPWLSCPPWRSGLVLDHSKIANHIFNHRRLTLRPNPTFLAGGQYAKHSGRGSAGLLFDRCIDGILRRSYGDFSFAGSLGDRLNHHDLKAMTKAAQPLLDDGSLPIGATAIGGPRDHQAFEEIRIRLSGQQIALPRTRVPYRGDRRRRPIQLPAQSLQGRGRKLEDSLNAGELHVTAGFRLSRRKITAVL